MEVQALSPEVIQDTDPIPPAPSDTGSSSDTIPASEIDRTFKPSCIDLISASLTSTILHVSDEFFAPASNLLQPHAPIRRPGVFVPTGAWYDGWETRRHNPLPYDWAVVKLGVASGRVRGVEIDTAFFDGNHAAGVVVQGCFEVGEAADARVMKDDYKGWREILGWRPCGPSRRQAWKVNDEEREITHVRLCMFPDGGIARFRLYGVVVPVFPSSSSSSSISSPEMELSAATMGGLVLAASDEGFGSSASNLLLPGRGVDMGGGWETKRSREKGHEDWVVVKLGARGKLRRLVVDTAFYRGNFPRAMRVHGIEVSGEEEAPTTAEDGRWQEVVGEKELRPDREHEYEGEALRDVQGVAYTHLKLTIVPDGGVKRFRVFGTRA
ncbi:MAG: hypothetical protein LQ345_002573 [Seirophora villosa]|nr:MAG: hypothetical protein LQ345_002573 [Seirophora villosa]